MTVNIWAVEYSVNTDSYNMLPFHKMIERNNEMVLQGQSDDFKLIGIATTRKEARLLADKHALTLPEKILNL